MTWSLQGSKQNRSRLAACGLRKGKSRIGVRSSQEEDEPRKVKTRIGVRGSQEEGRDEKVCKRVLVLWFEAGKC